MQDFGNLSVWQKAHALTLAVYRTTKRFPGDEQYGLTNQLRRSCASVVYNIAEGCGRGTDADFARCLQIAMGSASEADYQLLLARDLGYLAADAHAELDGRVQEIKRMLPALISRLTAPPATPSSVSHM